MNGPLRVLVAALAISLSGCPPIEEQTACPAVSDTTSELLVVDRVVAGLEGGSTRVRGFPGAAPDGVSVAVDDETVAVEEDGSFDVVLDAPLDEVTLTATTGEETESVAFRVRSLDAALSCVSGPAFETGTLPNDLQLGPTCSGDSLNSALVTLTGDGSLDVVDLDDLGRPAATPYFPPAEGLIAAQPFAVARIDASRAAVSLRGLGTVALVEPCTGRTLDDSPPRTADSAWLTVDVDPPVVLREPRDVDGDGLDDTEVRRMRVSGPQALVFSGNRLWVAYTNVLEPALDEARPMTAGPGALLLFVIDDDVLIPDGFRVLPVQNPQALIADGEGGVWVAATGVYAYEDGRLVAGSDGALLQVTADLLIPRVIDAERFAPGTPTLIGDRLIVGSTLEAAVGIGNVGDQRIDTRVDLGTGGDDGPNSVFDTVALPGGLVGAVHFDTDTLHVLDPTDGGRAPWPFLSPIPLGDGGGTARGANAIALDGWRGAALLTLSAEVVPVDLRQVMGP